jgi:hypothetical protein
VQLTVENCLPPSFGFLLAVAALDTDLFPYFDGGTRIQLSARVPSQFHQMA